MFHIPDKAKFIAGIGELIFFSIVALKYCMLYMLNLIFDSGALSLVQSVLWLPILFLPVIPLFLTVKCLKLRIMFGYMGYAEARAVVNGAVRNGDISPGFAGVNGDVARQYAAKNIKYYTWLMHPKNMQALQIFSAALLFALIGCLPFPILFVLFVFSLARATQAVLEAV